MAVTLTGTSSGNQGLFNRWGVLGGALNDVNTARAAIDVSASDALALIDGANTTIRNTVADLTSAALTQIDALGSYPDTLATIAGDLGVEMFDADQPLPSKDVPTMLDALEKQMLTATTSYVDANTVSATPTMTSLTGNGNVVCSVKDGRGRNLENLLAERLVLEVTDSTVAGSESIRIRGEESESDKRSHRWPRGSGAASDYTSIDAAGALNLLTNGAFEDWAVADTPDDWTLQVGAAGTDVLDNTAAEFAGDHCLELVGDGAILHELFIEVENLESLTNYAVNCWMKADVVPAAGVLKIEIANLAGSVIADEAGTNGELSITCSGLTTSYVAKSFTFRLPEPLPTGGVFLRLRFTTALSNGSSVLVDHLSLAEMQQPSNDVGAVPHIAIFSGSTPWSLDDGDPNLVNTFKIETANNRVSLWQELLDKFFDTSATGFILPTSGTTLINDSLIT
jgi:hypothetical protein